MFTIRYRGTYYINGKFGTKECEVLHSPTGYGHTWRKTCKTVRAAKLAATKHLKGTK